MKTFEQLGLSEDVLKVLKKKGFEVPTPIQEQAIPILLSQKKNILGQARTGTGKTAAFGLPILEKIEKKANCVQALVLTPTRELAIQVAEEIHSLKGKKRLSIIPVYGGQSINIQLRSLKKGVDILVGTPGRIIDHIKRGTLKLGNISYLVLDEADEMLNMGFIDEVNQIIECTPDEKQTLLFSATVPKEIAKIAKNYLGEYETIKVVSGGLTATKTDQIYFEVSPSDKFEALCRILDMEENFYGLIFCRTKRDVDEVASHLIERGYDADGLHGDISQSQREKVLGKFRKNLINVLVATDVAARGIDIQDLTHVINYALPQDPESYVHRIGRTGRAGKEGVAITFVTPAEYRRLQVIERKTKSEIRKAHLPNVSEVIKAKRSRIKTYIQEILNEELGEEYVAMAKELLDSMDPVDTVSALLQYAFYAELDEKNYAEIQKPSSIEAKGTTRLFIKKGSMQGLTRKKLISFVSEKCRIHRSKIQDILVLEKFSFITLPFQEAEEVLRIFKKQKKNADFVIQKAKAPKSKQPKKKKNK